MGEIIPLTKALLEHHQRREQPRFEPVKNWFVIDEASDIPEIVWGALEGKTSDNLRIRPYRPTDDDDPGDAA